MRYLLLPLAFLLPSLLPACGTGSEGTWQADSDAALPGQDSDTPENDGAALDDVAASDADAATDDAPVDVANADAAVGTGTLEKHSYAGPEGTRDYLLYTPAGYDGSPLPLVVALHGCSESASHFAYVTQYNMLADTERFFVAWPEQTAIANTMMCWNWFLPAHQQRDVGEAAIIAGITHEVMNAFAVDPDRVHAVGISAGGGMALVLGTVFPDLFASVATVEGCPFQGSPCVGSPSTLPVETLAGLAFDAMGTHARALPVFVVQGDVDLNVPAPNGEIIVQQYLGVADRADDGTSNQSVSRQPAQTSSGSVPGGHSYDVDLYVDATQQPLIERWLIHGMAHAWPGGPSAIAYSDPAGPDGTSESYRFFGEHPMP